MGRLISPLTCRLPSLTLSTDIIVGYPGETDDDFEETYRAMDEIGYDSAYMFKFSPRRGTATTCS